MAKAAQLPGAAALLEREAEIETIQALVQATRRGAGSLLAIEGRAGMGKTRLLAEARKAADSADLEVLAARGGELEQEFAFGVVRQLFEPLLAGMSVEERAELTSGAATLALPLFEESQLASQQGAAADTSFAMLHGLYWLAANVALRRPTFIAVDDLHWADAPSLRWIAYLARRLEGVPVLVAVTTRPPGQSRESAVLAELLSDPAAALIRLGPLRTPAIGALAAAAFETDPEPAFVAACERATGGNPLFLHALLDTLARDGVMPTAENAFRALETGPEAISRLVAVRLARLPDEASALMSAAAVLGDGAQLHQVAALAGLDVPAAARAATLLVRSDLLRGDDPVEFVHPVVRTATYEEMSASERTSGHRRAAELLVDAGAPPEQAAAHLLLTRPSGDAFVSETLRRAAERAVGRGAPQAAIAYLRRALEEPPPEANRVDVLQALGIAELHTDAFAAVEHLREGLRLAEGPIRRAEAAFLYVRALIWLDKFDVAVDVLREAIDELGDGEPERRELLEAVLIGCALWMPELQEIRFERMATVREDALRGGLGAAAMRSILAFHEARIGHSRERAVALAERALASGLLSGSETLWALTAMVTLAVAGEVEAARAAYDAAVDDARRRGDLLDLVPLLLLRGWLASQQGDLFAAEEDLLSPELGLAEAASTTVANGAGLRADLLLEQGRRDEAIRILEALRGNEPMHAEYRLWYLYARGRVELRRGRPERAIAEFRRTGAEMEALREFNPALVAWRSEAALALRLLDRDAEAEALAREEVELARRWGAARPIGVSLRALGLVKGGREGESLLREAVDVLAESPARLEYARALVDLGAAVRRANRRSEGRDALVRGLDLAHRAGAVPLVRQAQEELAAMGARPRKLVVTGVDALTASERRVARMAAEGMSNKEIAQALFVTVKAVEVHLSSVYRKLGIDSRRRLPEALGEARSDPAVHAV
ncbi:MAG: AAA family ATPase [Actinomycetota bacterium]|nr:AAA family ATPase [Actinomycetota bacterium]